MRRQRECVAQWFTDFAGLSSAVDTKGPFLSMNTILLKNENRTWRTRTNLQTFLWFWLTVPVSGFVYVSVVQGLGWNTGRRTYFLTELSSGTKKHCQCKGSPGVKLMSNLSKHIVDLSINYFRTEENGLKGVFYANEFIINCILRKERVKKKEIKRLSYLFTNVIWVGL